MLALALAPTSRAEDPAPDRVIGVDLGVTFALPHGWLVLQEPSAVPPASAAGKEPVLLFYARPDDPSFLPGPKWQNDAWLSVSKLPAPARPGAVLSPPGAEQTEALKQVLTQEGYRISESATSAQLEGDVAASSGRFYCFSESGPPVIVEVSRWEANGEVVVAQMRYSEAVRPDLLQSIKKLKASFLLKGQSTLAFGEGLKKGLGTAIASASPLVTGSASPSPRPVPAAPAATAAVSPASSGDATADIIHNLTDSLVFIEGATKAGSGFICTLEKEKCLVTNIHVMNGNRNPQFTLLDGAPIQVGNAFAAVDHDVFSYLVTSGGKPIEVMKNVEQNVAIGDEVLVLGNAQGQRVINAIQGTVVGIGPNLVEVSAPFVQGNSGSPVVHKKTGKVIGVATYIVERITPDGDRNAAPRRQIRRFAYRLDTIKQWQPVVWPQFYAQGATMDNIEQLTRDLETFCRELLSGENLRPGLYREPAILQPVDDYAQVTGMSHMSQYDRTNAKKDLLSAIRAASQADVAQAGSKLTYDYFQRELVEQRRERDEFARFFQRITDEISQ